MTNWRTIQTWKPNLQVKEEEEEEEEEIRQE